MKRIQQQNEQKFIYILINEERMNERKKIFTHEIQHPITKQISRIYRMNEKKSSSHVTRTTQFDEWATVLATNK